MDPAHPLLQAVGVPWDVPVDQVATELEVNALARGIGCHHDLGPHPELPLCTLTGIYVHTAVDRSHCIALFLQTSGKAL